MTNVLRLRLTAGRAAVGLQSAIEEWSKTHRVVSVVPLMQSYFGTAPERYETTEVLLVMESK